MERAGVDKCVAGVGIRPGEDESACARLCEATGCCGGVSGNGQGDGGICNTDTTDRACGECEVAIGSAVCRTCVFQGASAKDEVAYGVSRVAKSASDSTVGDCGDAQSPGVDRCCARVGVHSREHPSAGAVFGERGGCGCVAGERGGRGCVAGERGG